MIHIYYHIYAIDGVESIIDEQLNLINTQRNTVIARTKKIREQQGNACDIDNENQKMLKVLSKVCKNFASASKV